MQIQIFLLTASILMDAASLLVVSLVHVTGTAQVNIPSVVVISINMQDFLALNTQYTNINQLQSLPPGLRAVRTQRAHIPSILHIAVS